MSVQTLESVPTRFPHPKEGPQDNDVTGTDDLNDDTAEEDIPEASIDGPVPPIRLIRKISDPQSPRKKFISLI